MRKIALCILLFIFYTNSHAQIRFESGYFIDNQGKRTEALIKNSDWRNNPTEFQYKLSESGEKLLADISDVKEFGISNFSKYVRATVNIDRSSINLKRLSRSNLPNWSEEKLFLKVMVEGEATLYHYRENDIRAFFYNSTEQPIQQLIYRKYFARESFVVTDDRFKQQLSGNLRCGDIPGNRMDRLTYTRHDLVSLLVQYNQCVGSPDLHNYYALGKKKNTFKLRIKPGLHQASLLLANSGRPSRNIDFKTNTGYKIGLEGEFVLPFNQNKWTIFFEPSWQHISYEVPNSAVADYSSIGLSIGVRHYFYLTNTSRVFLNAMYSHDFDLGSGIDVELYRFETLQRKEHYDLFPAGNFALGMGLNFHMLSAELRYYTRQDLLGDHITWAAYLNRVSFVMGIQLF